MLMPALLTAQSSRPNRETVRSTQGLDLSGNGDVGRDEYGFAAGFKYPLHCLQASGSIHVRDYDFASEPGEGLGGCPTDSRASSRDQRYFSVQAFVHLATSSNPAGRSC